MTHPPSYLLFAMRKQLHRTHHNLVRLVPNLEILAHIPNISRYKGFELYGQVFPRLSQFGGVTGLYFLFLAIGDDFLYKALRNLIACQELTKILVLALQLLAMGVDELQAVVDDDALGCKQAMHLGVLGRIERHEIIGHDASAAINHTMLAQGVILQRVGQMDAVLVGELAVLVAVVEIHGIILALALLVRLLDASAARRIVMGYGET